MQYLILVKNFLIVFVDTDVTYIAQGSGWPKNWQVWKTLCWSAGIIATTVLNTMNAV